MTWRDLEDGNAALAAFGAARLARGPAYLATVDAAGRPRVHPVTPIVGDGALFVFMEPTSPKGRDLVERGAYALHSGVPDTRGSGGEFAVRGDATQVTDADRRAAAANAAPYDPADRYVLFELGVREARCVGYGDVALPSARAWSAA